MEISPDATFLICGRIQCLSAKGSTIPFPNLTMQHKYTTAIVVNHHKKIVFDTRARKLVEVVLSEPGLRDNSWVYILDAQGRRSTSDS